MGCLQSCITHKDEGHVLHVSQNTCGTLGNTDRATWNYTFVTIPTTKQPSGHQLIRQEDVETHIGQHGIITPPSLIPSTK